MPIHDQEDLKELRFKWVFAIAKHQPLGKCDLVTVDVCLGKNRTYICVLKIRFASISESNWRCILPGSVFIQKRSLFRHF